MRQVVFLQTTSKLVGRFKNIQELRNIVILQEVPPEGGRPTIGIVTAANVCPLKEGIKGEGRYHFS